MTTIMTTWPTKKLGDTIEIQNSKCKRRKYNQKIENGTVFQF